MSFSREDQLKYKALYLQTAGQYVHDLQDKLNLLVSGKETQEVIDTLHRDAHSLKGQSEMMGYHAIGAFSSLMEKIFLAKKENKLVLSDLIVTQLVDGVKEMEACLDEIEKVNKEIDMYQPIGKLQTLTKIK